jgi:hypothetical protein
LKQTDKREAQNQLRSNLWSELLLTQPQARSWLHPAGLSKRPHSRGTSAALSSRSILPGTSASLPCAQLHLSRCSKSWPPPPPVTPIISQGQGAPPTRPSPCTLGRSSGRRADLIAFKEDQRAGESRGDPRDVLRHERHHNDAPRPRPARGPRGDHHRLLQRGARVHP